MRELAPKDDLTGLPLPIAPGNRLLPIDNKEEANWHHHWHPSNHPVFKTTGGMALRNSRVQLVDILQHNQGKQTYHSFFEGVEIPENEDEQFRLCVLAAAGYLPADCLDFSAGEPERRPLSSIESLLMRIPDIKRGYTYHHLTHRYNPMQQFFAHYVIKQDISHVSESHIEQFLTSPKPEVRRYMGHLLLAKATEVAAEKVAEDYNAIRKAGKLHPLVPFNAYRKVQHTLGSPERREQRVIPKLRERLVASIV